MSYSVKEIFYSLQGEGFYTGRPAVFCRFSGCNLWSGREKDRAGAVCTFCDTDFSGTDGPGGGRFASAEALAEALAALTPPGEIGGQKLLVLTGGEPLLQVDQSLLEAVGARGFETAVETNGTRPAPDGIDWLCVSPKAGSNIVLRQGNELKLVYPQRGAEPEKFEDLAFDHFFLLPRDGSGSDVNLRLAVEYCLEHPRWRLSLQIHKYLGIP